MSMALGGITLGLILIGLLGLLLIVGQRSTAVERVPVWSRWNKKH